MAEAFEFDDSFMDKVPRLGPVTIDHDEISLYLQFRDLRERLMPNESVRLPVFSVNQQHRCLADWRFELRLFPCGQNRRNSKKFNVYLVAVACPKNQHQRCSLDVLLTVGVPAQHLFLYERKRKVFVWERKEDRYLRLSVPTSQIRYRTKLFFSVKIISDHNCQKNKQEPEPKNLTLKKRFRNAMGKNKNDGKPSPAKKNIALK